MKKPVLILLAALVVLVTLPVVYFFVVVPVLNDRANGILLVGSGEQIEADVKKVDAGQDKRSDYPVKWEEKTLIVSETTAREWTQRQLILRKAPKSADKREALAELPIRPEEAEGLLFAADKDQAVAEGFPLNGSPANLGYAGDYFLGNLRLTESAIVVLPDERYEAVSLPEQQLTLLKFGLFQDVSEKVGDFPEGSRLVKIDQKKK